VLAVKPADLLSLAHSRAPADRERLLGGVIELCNAAQDMNGSLPAEVATLVEGVFVTLIQQAERDIRKSLSERLSEAAWAPAALINMLVHDEIDIAQPVITYSPVLADSDLLRLLVEATLDHQLTVASRPGLPAPVVDKIVEAGNPALLTALAANETAEVTPDALNALVDHARRIVAMRSPLARHPRLSSELAERLYAWVGDSLKTALCARFRLDPVIMDKAVAEAARSAAASAPLPPAEEERDDMDRSLVEKLIAAGELRTGYLMRALREGRLNLFIHILAGLGSYDVEQLRRAMDGDRPELLGLACAGVGVDRSAFPTLLSLVRELNRQRPGGGQAGASRALGAFGPFDPDIARSAFRQAAGKV
jgi:uncharacterized protein (DUF2336 family)